MSKTDAIRPAIVMAGNVFEGFKFYGPFPDFDAACEWAESPAGPACETIIATLEARVEE